MWLLSATGIGKSYFAVYVLHHALQDGQTVLFHHTVSRIAYLFKPGEPVTAGPVDNYLNIVGSESRPALFLIDLGTKVRPSFPNLGKKIIAFSSPNELNYVDLCKMMSTTKLYISPWSWDEIKDAAMNLKHLKELSSEVVLEGFDMYGGIPHYILQSNPHTRAETMSALKRAIESCSMEVILQVIRTKTDHGYESHKIFHRILLELDGTDKYYNYTFVFGSSFIMQYVFKNKQNAEYDQ